jgi:hypothetical protein
MSGGLSMSIFDEPPVRTALIPLKNAIKALDAERAETKRAGALLQRAQEDAKRHAEENADLILQMRRITRTGLATDCRAIAAAAIKRHGF